MPRFRTFILACALAGALCSAAAPGGAAPDTAAKAAQQLLDGWSGRPEPLMQARQILEKALAQAPSHPELLKQSARWQLLAGYRRDVDARFGTHQYSVGEYHPGAIEGAEATIRKAIALNPGFAGGHVLLGHILTEREKLHEAIESLDRAEALGSDDPWLHLNRAAVHTAMGEHASAAERLERVVRDPKADSRSVFAARQRLLDGHKRHKRHDEAIALFEAQIASPHSNAWDRGNFSTYLRQLGRNDEAIAQARAALAMMDYGIGRLILGRALHAKWADLVAEGREAEGEALFREARTLYPDLDKLMVNGGSEASGERLVKALVAKGVSIDVRDGAGSSALLVAVNTNEAEAVRFLLALKADPNVVDRDGWTPLISAADEGNEETVRLLLAAGADARARRNGRDAAAFAESRGLFRLAQEIRAKAAQQKVSAPGPAGR